MVPIPCSERYKDRNIQTISFRGGSGKVHCIKYSSYTSLVVKNSQSCQRTTLIKVATRNEGNPYFSLRFLDLSSAFICFPRYLPRFQPDKCPHRNAAPEQFFVGVPHGSAGKKCALCGHVHMHIKLPSSMIIPDKTDR